MMILLLLIIVGLVGVSSASNTTASDPPIALPGCQDRCGNVSIPYPFGITPNCAHSSSFEIICNTTFQPPKAYPSTLWWKWLANAPHNNTYHTEIVSIDLGTSPLPTNNGSGTPSTLVIYTGSSGVGVYSGQQNLVFPLVSLDMRGSPYLLMGGKRNSLVVAGCGGSAILRNSGDEIVVACSSLCTYLTTPEATQNVSCCGIGCCQTTIPTSLDYFRIELLTTVLQGSNTSDAIMGFVSDTSYIENYKINMRPTSMSIYNFGMNVVPTTLQWTVPDLPIDSPEYSNSWCDWDASLKGYSCRCRYGYYQGNPYLPNGCRVIKECEQCPKTCASTVIGNNRGYICPTKPKKSPMPLVLGLAISLGSVLLSVILFGLYQMVKKSKEKRQKQNNFKRNGGLLLQQQMSTTEGAIERSKIFTCDELEKATDNFNENRILGRGGQGTVYKGMLVDGTIVAVKKSQKVDETQLEPFINEVVILSQVNHRNVVKLFGCCLETEVPLLVYEFVPNGTLFQHIHKPNEDFRITWKMRLQIAIDSAEALAYLHSSSSTPIYHRDIKTSNILLDDKYRAKVSDFGTSKTISIDQTHVTTCVQGTFGYIDPEFFQSNQFTEKSDVYSFGVVLVELITSKTPISGRGSKDSRSLASEFLILMQNSRLYDIVDAAILEEAKREELDDIADLAKNCLHMVGKQRPTMKEVVTILQMTISKNHANGLSPSSKNLLKGKESFIVNQISMVSDRVRDPLSYSSAYTSSKDPQDIQDQPLLSTTEFI